MYYRFIPSLYPPLLPFSACKQKESTKGETSTAMLGKVFEWVQLSICMNNVYPLKRNSKEKLI